MNPAAPIKVPWTGVGRNLIRLWVDTHLDRVIGYDLIRAAVDGDTPSEMEGKIGGRLNVTVSGAVGVFGKPSFLKVRGRKERYVDLECELRAAEGRIVEHTVVSQISGVTVENSNVVQL